MRVQQLFAILIGVISGIAFFSPEKMILSGKTHAALPTQSLRIVNMGDSYASGPGIAPVLSVPCLRSGANYAHVAAEILHAQLVDVSCSGAVSQDFYTPQMNQTMIISKPQLTALSGSDDIVLVSIGGNDAKLVSAFAACGYEQFTLWGCHNQLLQVQYLMTHQVQNNLIYAYQQIRKKDPKALIIIVGYGSILSDLWCLNAPFGPETRHDMITTFDLMNSVLKKISPEVQGKYFDTQKITQGHDLCSYHPWYYGILPGQANAGFIGHPNITAMNVEGRYLANFISRTWHLDK